MSVQNIKMLQKNISFLSNEAIVISTTKYDVEKQIPLVEVKDNMLLSQRQKRTQRKFEIEGNHHMSSTSCPAMKTPI